MNTNPNVTRRTRRQSEGRQHQRGSLVINLAIAMSLIVIVLIGTELGYLFYMKREMQKAADLAALAGAQQIANTDGCTAARTAAKLSANGTGESDSKRNLPSIFAISDNDIECGQWDPLKTNQPDHFEVTTIGQNAVRVTISKIPMALFPSFGADRTITGKAVAANNPIASFSIGTGLASLDGGVVNKLLNALLGTGNSINLDIVSYKGLANTQIRLLDLIAASPGVGTVDQLLKTEVTVRELTLLMLKVIDPSNTLAVDVLNSIISASVSSVRVKIGDLLNVTTPSPEAAASANINAFDLLMVAAQVSNGTNFINLGTALDLGPILKIESKLKIVEPPSIAIGEAGKDINQHWKTQAHSASVRLFLDASIVDTSKIPVINGILNIQALHLPLYIEAAPGDAWLSNIQCNNPRKNSVVSIGVQPGLANVCIADNLASQMGNTSAPASCNAPATVSRISILDILGSPIGIDVKATVPLSMMTPPSPNAPTLQFDGVIGNDDDIQRTNSNAVGSVLSNTVRTLTRNLELKACVRILFDICLNASAVAGLLNTLNNLILTPVLGLLDSIVEPLLTLLGAQLGYSDVHHQSLTCGEAKLVY